jgi:hypothetical protein
MKRFKVMMRFMISMELLFIKDQVDILVTIIATVEDLRARTRGTSVMMNRFRKLEE